jgi:hypothetical protein
MAPAVSLAPTPESLAALDLRNAMEIRCVEEVDAQIQRAMDKRNGIALTLRTAGVHVGDSDTHQSKSDGGRFDTTLAGFAILHGVVMGCNDRPSGFVRLDDVDAIVVIWFTNTVRAIADSCRAVYAAVSDLMTDTLTR